MPYLILAKTEGTGGGAAAPWTDFSAYSYDSVNVPLAGGVTQGRAMDFSPDGTRMYLGDTNSNPHYIAMWTLSTPWDLSTATYTNNVGLSTGDFIFSIRFKPDGTLMLISLYSSRIVQSYTLSTPWDVSTASYAAQTSAFAGGARMASFDVSPDGTKGYAVMRDITPPFPFETETAQYNFPTPWDITTLGGKVNATNMDPSSYNGDVRFHPDGDVMLRVESYHTVAVQRYTLSTPWNVTTNTYQDQLSVSGQVTYAMSAYISPDASKMYVLDFSTGVYQYSK